ncbi:MAG TPA: zf-HC2 domain-containing protein [Gemmatimonadales bacterium]|nr:zf-HC2 domain-containing protein [Gemmatimonadales bacterium]
MSHLDEGTLHALLDGELDLHEVKEIQAHIGSCAACGTRLREVKEFHGEADRLVGVLEMPTGPSRRTAPAEPEPSPFGDSPVDRRRTPRNAGRISGQVNEPPPLLLPESSGYQRGGFIRRMRWAALVLVTVGAGYMVSQMRRSSNYAFEGELNPLRLGDSTPVLSEEERSPAVANTGDESLQAAAKAAPAAESKAPAEVPRRVAPRPQPAAPQVTKQRTEPSADRLDEKAGLAAAGTVAAAANDTDQANEAAEADGPAPESGDVREEAALALRELDRERQVERAAAATAALDSVKARETVARQAVAAPVPRTPEQRAGVYLRIGLDEAAKQLGRPVHVIEGMSPMFMGLVLGKNSPGADPSRPVVRVVYQDSQGRLIFLDQQRIRTGRPTEAAGDEPRWTQGEIALRLGGEVGADILRNYRGRVR